MRAALAGSLFSLHLPEGLAHLLDDSFNAVAHQNDYQLARGLALSSDKGKRKRHAAFTPLLSPADAAREGPDRVCIAFFLKSPQEDTVRAFASVGLFRRVATGLHRSAMRRFPRRAGPSAC